MCEGSVNSQLRLVPVIPKTIPKSHAEHSQKFPKGVWFLKGPIPLSWLTEAMALPGKTGYVGLCLWFQRGLKNCETFKFSHIAARQFYLGRRAVAQGLQRLEQVGLITIEKRPGCAPIITMEKIPNAFLPESLR